MLANSRPPSMPQSNGKIKIMIIDDSAVIRGLVSKWIGSEADFEIVGFGINGSDGVNRITSLKPDIVILDIEMPIMDGITALPLLLKAQPGVKVIMASTLTKAGAEVTIKALTLGATDYIAKPDAGRIAGADEYKRELFQKLRALGRRRIYSPSANPAPNSHIANNNVPHASPISALSQMPHANNVRLRTNITTIKPEALFIGSSTGGPEALRVVVGGLANKVRVPVFLTQHMPVLFTKILAEHLAKQTGANVVEAEHDTLAVAGTFYIAPGGKHMVVARNPSGIRILLNENPPENFCRPAVDPLFRSGAQVYGDRAMGVILTGMGHDGRDGAKVMAQNNSHILVQDEETSVVWGMPGAAAQAGVASSMKPLKEIPTTILNILSGVRS